MRTLKYHRFTFCLEPIDKIKIGGSKHTIDIKSIDLEHAIKHAKKYEKFSINGKQVYRLVLDENNKPIYKQVW